MPLNNLGVDSLLGVQLVADLEQRFTVPIPERLFTDPDTSLSTVAVSLQHGGIIKPRALLINGWDIAAHGGFIRSVTKGEYDGEPVSSQWLRERATMANIDNGSFPRDTVFIGSAPLPPSTVTSKLNLAIAGLLCGASANSRSRHDGNLHGLHGSSCRPILRSHAHVEWLYGFR